MVELSYQDMIFFSLPLVLPHIYDFLLLLLSLCIYSREYRGKNNPRECWPKSRYIICISFSYIDLFFSIMDVEKQRTHVRIYTKDKSSLPIERKIWNKNILPQTLIYVYIHRYLFLMYHQHRNGIESEREKKSIVDD